MTTAPSEPPDPDPDKALRVLGSFIRPLPPEERAKRDCIYSGAAGYLTREDLILSMLEVDAGWKLAIILV